MIRKGNLYSIVCDIGTLHLADSIARLGKENQYGVKKHDPIKEQNLLQLQESLINKTYKTSTYSTFKVFEPKERDVSRLPYYPDRIAHHGIMIPLKPIFTSSFTADTYGNIEGRGPHKAADKIKEVLRKDEVGTQYCLKLDIRKFYPSVNHGILKKQLRRKIKDKDLLWLLDEIIDSAPGLPIGNYTSQYFSNFYLTGFDHWIKQEKKVKYYFRYVDDIVILAPDKESLQKLFIEIRQYLSVQLNLTVKSNYQIFPVAVRGIDFLGYVFFHKYTLLRKSIKKRFARAIAKGASRQTLAAYWGWVKHCDGRNLMNELFKKAA